jgi:hypothetical protein
MAAKKAKLQEQFSEDAAKEGGSQSNSSSNIFHGVAIFVNGYTGMCSVAAWLVPCLEHASELALVQWLSFLKVSHTVTITSNDFTE